MGIESIRHRVDRASKSSASVMKYGLELPTYGPCSDARILGEFGHLAERAGWDGVFLEDYIVHYNHAGLPENVCDPWVSLSTIAANTTRIRIGTTVTPLARRRPWKLARETVSIDHLSKGRLTLGVGLGDIEHEGRSFSDFGETIDIRKRAEMVDEALEVLTGLWSGESFTYHGKYYSLKQTIFLPRPVQRPRIPIWIGGNWPHQGVMNRAARWDGFVGGKEHTHDQPWCLTPDELRALKIAIQSRRKSLEGFDIALGGASRGNDWKKDQETISSLEKAGATWWMEYVTSNTFEKMSEVIRQGPLRIG